MKTIPIIYSQNEYHTKLIHMFQLSVFNGYIYIRGRRGRMVAGFTAYAISAYHH